VTASFRLDLHCHCQIFGVQVLKDLFHAELMYTSTFAGGTQHPDRKDACQALSAAFVDSKTSRIREPDDLTAELDRFMNNAEFSKVADIGGVG